MSGEQNFEEQDEIIQYTKVALDKIQNSETQIERDTKIYGLMAYLISSSNDMAQNGDLYEAAGRLYSAAYYLEEIHPKNARKIYQNCIKFYNDYFHQVVIKGGVQEAAKIALKIATIYKTKLNDKRNEVNYIQKAIGLIANQIIILEKVGSARDLCGRYLTLSLLYLQLQDWKNVIISAQSAIEVGKLILDYSIISNAYNSLADAHEKQFGVSESHEILLEAINYFIGIAEIHEAQSQNLQLSQLYQIIKNIYKKLNDFPHFQQYSRKEAGVYIFLAKAGISHNISKTQIGSYYRGAGLCYMETLNNYLDSASCFFIAGNYYFDAKKFLNAATNYEDGARMFEYLKNFKKAQELYQKAGNFFFKAENPKSAIVNYIASYQMSESGGLKCPELLHILIKVLSKQIDTDLSQQNHFAAAALSFEKIHYLQKLSPLSHEDLKDKLSHIHSLYLTIYNDLEKVSSDNMQGYILVLLFTLSHVLNHVALRDEVRSALQKKKNQFEFDFVDFSSFLMEKYPYSLKTIKKMAQSNFSAIFANEDFSELRALLEIISKVQQF